MRLPCWSRSDFVQTLNPSQREAIRHLDSPCLVIAGAGSGKTRVITQKIVHLIDSGMRPSAIAAITFTNKAAQEMQQRLAGMIKSSRERPVVSTFHSLGVQILRRDGQSLGLKKGFSIIDSADAQAILQDTLATTDRKLLRHAAALISGWKNALVDADQAGAASRGEAEHAVARAYRNYQATLRAYQAVDFDDLIGLPLTLFQQHPEALKAWREKLRYLLVDEYQDTNVCQYELLKLLAGPRAAFTAVGDDDQSIYGWRGATLENLARLGRDFPELKVIKLEQNYRSTVSILTAANRLIGHNPKLYPKRLWSEHGVGDPVQVIAFDSDEQEAESVVARMQAHRFERRGGWGDYAILYRGNHQARQLEQALRNEKVPYTLSGGQSFFERSEIRDLIAYLRLLINDDDDPALIRALTTPKRGIGAATLQTLGTYAGERHQSMFAAMFETGIESRLSGRPLAILREFGTFIQRIAWRAAREPAAAVIDDLLSAIDYRSHLFETHEEKQAVTRWQNVTSFIDWLKARAEPDPDAVVGRRGADSARDTTLLEIAQTVSLLTRLDRQGEDSDAVRLTTIHASKGLEFPHVFVVGCEEGLLPHRGDEAADADEGGAVATDGADAESQREAVRVEEERRLMYVAVTRAERSLTLSWCRQRKKGRELQSREPSRFITEMQLEADQGGKKMLPTDAARQKLSRLKDLLAATPRPKMQG